MKQEQVVLAIDQSTSATKAMLFTTAGELRHRVTVGHTTNTPSPGYVEQDAEEILHNAYRALREVVEDAGVSPDSLSYLAVTNQRETVVLWDSRTGKPASPVLSWQDSRGATRCAGLRLDPGSALFQEKTGLLPDAYFSASKVEWAFAWARDSGVDVSNLLWGTIDSWLIWNLTGGGTHATDFSNASRTLLFNINDLTWDEDLLKLFHVPPHSCPEVRSSDADFGRANIPGVRTDLPICGVMGDSQSALFGQGGFDPSVVKATYGTGSSVALNIGTDRIAPPEGVVTSLAWGLDGRPEYVWEGNIHSTGDTIRWIQKNLGLVADTQEAARSATSVPDNGGVYIVPAFSGLGAPYWENAVTGLITGLTHAARREHLIRAAMESIPLQVFDLLQTMATHAPVKLRELRADGGATANSFVMQLQSDLIRMPVRVARIEELSALGAVYMGGIAQGLFSGTGEVANLWAPGASYTPQMSFDEREKLVSGWKQAVDQVLVPVRGTAQTIQREGEK